MYRFEMQNKTGPSTVPSNTRSAAQNDYGNYSTVKQRGIDPCHSPYSRGIGVARGGKKAAMQGDPSYRKVD